MNLYEFFNQLNEEFVPWPEEKSQRIFEATLNRLKSVINLDLRTLKEVDLNFSSSYTFGNCGLGYKNNAFVQSIAINERLQCDELEDIFINNVCHEFCHFILNCQLIEKSYVLMENGVFKWNFPSKKIEDYYRANAGHGKYFIELAAEISQKMNLKYPITPTVDDICRDVVNKIHKDNWTYELKCDDCGKLSTKFYTKTFEDFFKDIIELFSSEKDSVLVALNFLDKVLAYTFEGKPNYICGKCQGNVGLLTNNDSNLDGFRENVNTGFMLIYMKTMFNI